MDVVFREGFLKNVMLHLERRIQVEGKRWLCQNEGLAFSKEKKPTTHCIPWEHNLLLLGQKMQSSYGKVIFDMTNLCTKNHLHLIH